MPNKYAKHLHFLCQSNFGEHKMFAKTLKIQLQVHVFKFNYGALRFKTYGTDLCYIFKNQFFILFVYFPFSE